MSQLSKPRLFVLACLLTGYNWIYVQDAMSRRGDRSLMERSTKEYFEELERLSMFRPLTPWLRQLGFEPTGGEAIKVSREEYLQIFWGARKAALQVLGMTPELPRLPESKRVGLDPVYMEEIMTMLQAQRDWYSLAQQILRATDKAP